MTSPCSNARRDRTAPPLRMIPYSHLHIVRCRKPPFRSLICPSLLLQESKGLCAFPVSRNIRPQAPFPAPILLGRCFPALAKFRVAIPVPVQPAAFVSAHARPVDRAACRRHRAANSAELRAIAGGQHRGLGCPS